MKLFGERFLIGSLMICFQNIYSQTTSKSSWDCAGQTISLECPENAAITILTAQLGYSDDSPCKPSHYCRVNTNPSHIEYLKSECNGRQKCSITATKGKISCSGWVFWWSTHFEYITYNCDIKPEKEHSTPARSNGSEGGNVSNRRPEEPASPYGQHNYAGIADNEDEYGSGNEDAEPTNMTKVIVVVTICAILILVAIIILVVIIWRRKKKQVQVNAMEMSDVVNVKNEEAYVNTDPRCNKQNSIPESGTSSFNNPKECNITNNTAPSHPYVDYESKSIAKHPLGSESPNYDLLSHEKSFIEDGEEILIDNELYSH